LFHSVHFVQSHCIIIIIIIMSKKPFDYSKWDNIELSDDEDDVHPNIDKESWFRMKHRSRLEREENEAKDRARIRDEMEKNNQRIKVLEHDLAKIELRNNKDDNNDDDTDDDDDLDDREGMRAELEQLKNKNAAYQKKLDDYEKHKKWNVDNMFQVKEERTVVSKSAGNLSYTPSGFVVDKNASSSQTATKTTPTTTSKPQVETTKTLSSSAEKTTAVIQEAKKASSASKPIPSSTSTSSTTAVKAGPMPPPEKIASSVPVGPISSNKKSELGAMETYQEFTERHADLVEEFMKCKTLEESRDFLLKHGDILLQENASNYLLLASLEDEMNGYRDKMKLTARQSQIISSIAELAKTVQTHPGNVIMPFFQRLQNRAHLEDFLAGVKEFQEKIIQRAIVKRQEIDEQRAAEQEEATDLHDVPREQRLGPGGLDPLEVIETLPESMVKAFESRDVEQLRAALMAMDPQDAEYHMKRCIDSGLWVSGG
jgi:cell division cycle protein 37